MSTGGLAFLVLAITAFVSYSGLLFYGMMVAPGRGGPAAPEIRHANRAGVDPKRAA